ncbi:HET-domain-containing protein [Annulohypoxylon truncatum]|uniref:HET-domain-containing protein n=1 Tax=Annulohypoxylon truncatum TaxID=327061 RepID=UPI0020075E8C|nr:HET-domain-containing protein [Annulohypoxylon truncatum]KAI1215161.1 HET-domain-containing protein [Annulohypoxylon truncatum]
MAIQRSTSNPSASGTCESCILPYHRRSPIIWFQEKGNVTYINTDVSTLRRAREMGCEMCALICEALAIYSNIPIDQLPGKVWFFPKTFSIKWFFPVPNEEKRNSGSITLHFSSTSEFPCDSSWDLYKYFGKRNQLPARTDSEETFTRIKKWLKECTTGHSMCECGVNGELPTRFLDLHEVESDGIARLIEVKEASVENGKYACLSHCWGGNLVKNAMATKLSLDEMKQGILVETLPQTFRDAITATKKLDIRYLWIDSMCILQDDESDWDRESKRMATIYQNSIITVAATCSEDPTQGFFRSPSRFGSYLFQCRTASGQPVAIYLRRPLPHHEHYFQASFHPLLRRAWAYQERLLSPRYLHFTLGEVVWECNELMACQCCMEQCYENRHFLGPPTKLLYTERIKSVDICKLKANWSFVVSNYVHQALSFEKDRLRAIAGIVSTFCSVELSSNPGRSVMGRYIEGLWEDTICENLCWCVLPQANHFKPRRADWRKWKAPTWSWASIQDPSCTVSDIYSACTDTGKLAKVLEVEYITHPRACQEQVQYNCIRLELAITEMTLIENQQSDFTPTRYFKGFGRWKLQLDGKDLDIITTDVYPDYDYTIAGSGHIAPGSTVIGGLVLERRYGRGTRIEGLLLIPVDEENRLYERVGKFRTNQLQSRTLLSETRVISLV